LEFTIWNGCPGAGKTDRVRRLGEENIEKYGLSGTLIITFSRPGAEEITRRLRGDVPGYTHHGLGWKIVRMGAKSREEKVPHIADEKRARKVMEWAIVQESAALEYQEAQADMARVRDRGMEMETLSPVSQKVIRRYLKKLKDEHLIDFTGIMERARWELENNPMVKAAYEGWHIIEDEFHDANPYLEWPIIELLLRGAESFDGFASPSQTIYRFRGANWNVLKELFSRGRDVTEEFLQINHRSTKEIVDAARLLAGPDASDMVSEKGTSGEKVQLVDAVRPEMEVDAAMRQIAIWRSRGIPEKEIAVLGRTYNGLLAVERSLRQRKILYRLSGNRPDFLAGSEIRALYGYQRLAMNPMDDSILEAIIDYPPCGIGARTRQMLRGDEELTWDHLVSALGEPKKFRPQVLERIRKILDLREEWDGLDESDLSVKEKVGKVVEGSEIQDYLMTEGDWPTLKALQETIETASEFSSLGEFTERLGDDAKTPRAAEGITLSTMHGAKGCQYDAVLITQFADGLIPMNKGDEVEEKNLAFVALSRPRYHLTITINRTARMSPFLMGMELENTPWP
jgi:DNA helicase II / ATP-dependent DNA helicase PcrA